MSEHALVIGAGPAGLAAAIRLATWCETVTVAEARPRGRLRQAGEHLPPAGLRALAAAGLERLLDDSRHGESSGVRSAWGARDAMDRDYFFALPGRGLNLDRRAFDAALAGHAERLGVRLRFDTRLAALERAKAGHVATLAGPDGTCRATAGIVVDASGRRAVAARRLGARRRRLDQLVGVSGVIEGAPAGDDPGRLTIEAVEDGWWYGVRLADGTLSASFMTDAAVLRGHAQGVRGLWHERLAASALLGPLSGEGARAGRLAVFDAASQWLEPLAATGFIAAGDSAAAYDPLSSWGIAKGIEDGDAAARALGRAAAGEADALVAHASRRSASFARHCERRRAVYAAEARWPASPFWRARRGAIAHVTESGGSRS